jgi:hypothetical membrane protein
MATDTTHIKHAIEESYFGLRLCMVALAYLPWLIMTLGGYLLHGTPLLGSLSEYYHHDMRNVFVGTNFMIVVCLYLYKGYSNLENVLLNIAAVGMLLLTLIPLPVHDEGPWTAHHYSAMFYFLPAAAVCIFCARDKGGTLDLVQDPVWRARYDAVYRLTGTVMALAPLGAFLFDRSRVVLFAEIIAALAFGTFWLTKTLEIRRIRRQDQGGVETCAY